MGGAGAIGAFAHGVASLGLDPVDVVTGPGNNFVAAAKRAVAGVVGTDAEAGATEILIVADDTADPRLVAADLISQAEHDEQASAVLVTDVRAARRRGARPRSRPRAARTRHAERVAAALGGPAVGDRAGRRSGGGDGVQQRLRARAPRTAPRRSATRRTFVHAGAVFVGPDSPVSLGDYLAGSNHVLPDRRAGALRARDCRRRRSCARSRSSSTTGRRSRRCARRSSRSPRPRSFPPTARRSRPASKRRPSRSGGVVCPGHALPVLPPPRLSRHRLAHQRRRSQHPSSSSVPRVRRPLLDDRDRQPQRHQAVGRHRAVQPREGHVGRAQGLPGPARDRGRPRRAGAEGRGVGPPDRRRRRSTRTRSASRSSGPLRELDEVAYLRFASVYQAFDSLEDFESAIGQLRADHVTADHRAAITRTAPASRVEAPASAEPGASR